jgi:hypothetical protein
MEIERHYTITELAQLLNMSFTRVRLLVKDEPGVLRFAAHGKTRGPGRPTMYRIPESVVDRILRRNANPPA